MSYFYYLLNKMYHSYNHDVVKQFAHNEINKIVDDLHSLVSQSNKAIKTFNKIFITVANSADNDLQKNPVSGYYNYGLSFYTQHRMTETIYLELIKIANNLRGYFIKFMDVYFIGRFLDKDYITNAIAYTGASHSVVYIDILCKQFDFKVTHFHYAKIPDLEELNVEIRKTDLPDLDAIFFPPFLEQCSDITNFPEKFE